MVGADAVRAAPSLDHTLGHAHDYSGYGAAWLLGYHPPSASPALVAFTLKPYSFIDV